MRNRRLTYIVIAVLSIAMSSCGRTKPQTPSQRNGERTGAKADTTLLALMNVNLRMAGAADKEVLRFIEAQTETYAQMDCGCWMRSVVRHEDTPTPETDEQWTLALKVRNLKGEMLLDEITTQRIGHEETPTAVTEALHELHHGDSVVLVSPWYTAYGIHGNKSVPGYSNVIIELSIYE